MRPPTISLCITILLLASRASAAACDYIDEHGSAGELAKFGQAAIRHLQLEALENPAKFCADNLRARYLGANKKAFAKLGVSSIRDAGFTDASRKLIRTTEADPWAMTLLPDKDARLEALRRTSTISGINDQSFAVPVPRTDAQITRAADFFRGIDAAAPIDTGKFLGGIEAGALEYGACAKMNILNAPDCVRGLRAVQKLMAPKRGPMGTMSNLEDWKEILTNHKYQEGLRVAAQKMQMAITTGLIAPADNAFDLLTNSFLKAKMSPADAKDATFKVLGMIASGGPNTFDRLRSIEGADVDPNPPMSQLTKSIGFLSNAMPALDSLKQEKGFQLFSLPKEVKANCDNAKSYHFWLSANFARRLVTEDHLDPDTAAISTFIGAKGYQVARGFLAGKASNLAKTLAQETFSPVSQIIRTDLAYNASGAFFGAAYGVGKKPNIDLDESLRALIKKTPINAPLSLPYAESLVDDHKFQAFQLWDSAFAPDAAFNSVKATNPF